MGEIADDVLEGFLDNEGQVIDGTRPGYPRTVAEAEMVRTLTKTQRRRARRKRAAAARAAAKGA